MEIVKAEILWTRICPLRCSYCGMVTGKSNSLSCESWLKGIDNLKKIGCGFIAFYGAEPLYDFEKLPEVVGYTESLGIHTTVITSGMVPNFWNKVEQLYLSGAKSLSMSFDIEGIDKSSSLKNDLAVPALTQFLQLGRVRDVAAITTLTRNNYKLFIDSVKKMSQKKIWSFFDLIHQDRGQPGSKCKNYPEMQELLFRNEDIVQFISFLNELYELKEQGELCHTSRLFIDLLRDNPNLLTDYSWNCANYKEFPSWVTVDCDGFVYPCDDFQPDLGSGKKICVTELYNRWQEFQDIWKPIVKENCPGCLWGTHIDAHYIKAGKLPFDSYVHIGDYSSDRK